MWVGVAGSMLWNSSLGVGSLEYIFGIHHNILVISQVEITLLIYRTISQGNILAGVTALSIHYELLPLLKQNNLLGWVVEGQALQTSTLLFSGCCRVIQTPLNSLFDSPHLSMTSFISVPHNYDRIVTTC